MNAELVRLYGPGMSFYRSHLQSTGLEQHDSKTANFSPRRYSSTLHTLEKTNEMLVNKIGKLRINTDQLRHDLMNLELHVKAFNGELLATWQADTLTRLIETIYERHGWKLPGKIAVGDHIFLPRETLSTLYLKALARIKKETVTRRFGLPMRYYHALQRYREVAHLRSTNPDRTESDFARWLVSGKEGNWGAYQFWGRLFPLCYQRSVEQSADIL
ncbi:uncharacterized protein BP01DRAFT_59256 [Aspergillus saccharolyticus JOP 1030-1]|uniref:Uncharacterized protein n=1 Tax=Aspergillus saccharolyticus JOP 1030-1 TaxID=1450539 RepID=A0A318ZM17_9EURO|nr:hypothetical protein BP01DRAFT_59256 [Aspergillus saccharolyticus JOP 1030-1]PYH44880.1 hypothetical protein BP01DRAFT_59256 [Aspergillus saccharolyticus JOP 1030-1]